MSILNLFKKPNWKNKDASIRAQAVSQDTSPELEAQLSHISQNDESELVRTAALRRLDDYGLLWFLHPSRTNAKDVDPHR